jgi:hypothetical protein
MVNLVIKNNLKKFIKEVDKSDKITSMSADVGIELQKKVEKIIIDGLERAKANNRRTLYGKDL